MPNPQLPTTLVMAKKFACGDVVSGCSWSTITKDENELFQRISEHAKSVHKMTDIPDEIIQLQDLQKKINLLIKGGYVGKPAIRLDNLKNDESD